MIKERELQLLGEELKKVTIGILFPIDVVNELT